MANILTFVNIATFSKHHDPHLLPLPGPAWSSTGPTQLGLLDFDASCTLSNMARTKMSVFDAETLEISEPLDCCNQPLCPSTMRRLCFAIKLLFLLRNFHHDDDDEQSGGFDSPSIMMNPYTKTLLCSPLDQ